MSQIKTTELEGDLSVGRHVTAGGNVSVQGNTTVKKNLKVEGWLDAKNIKGPNKGIFLTVVKLREAYPLPHDGWWALVGNTLPAALYIADGGAWVSTGETAGNPTIDSQQYNEAVAALDAELKEVAADVTENKQSISQIRTQINTIGGTVNTLTSDVSGLKTRMTTAEGNITAINNSKGQANGIATLDASGRVPSSQLPGYVDDVVEFNAMVSDVTITPQSSSKKSTDVGCMVVYDSDHNTFLLAVSKVSLTDSNADDWGLVLRPTRTLFTPAPSIVGGDLGTPTISIGDYWQIEDNVAILDHTMFTYYNNWGDADKFGTGTANGRVPEAGKIYTSTSDNKTYRWGGSNLVIIGNDLSLGYTANSAFPGDEGKAAADLAKQNRNWLNTLEPMVRGALYININQLADSDEPFYSLRSALNAVPNELRAYGVVVSFLLADEKQGEESGKWVSYQWQTDVFKSNSNWLDLDQWKPFGGGGAAVGNTFNVTVEIPLPDGEYYTDIIAETQVHNVLQAVFDADVASPGLQITFAIGPGSWKTYQYIGPNVTEAQLVHSPPRTG